MKHYVYFFSYAGQSEQGGLAFSNTEVNVEEPITTFGQISKISKLLAEKCGWSTAFVLSYQLLREE